MREIWRDHVRAVRRSDTASSSSGNGPMSLVVGALATWRITHLLVEEDGPGDAVLRARRAAGASVIGRAMDCFYCSSMWVALPFAVGLTRTRGGHRFETVATWLALSGAACVLEQATRSDAPWTGPDDVRPLQDTDHVTDAPTPCLVLTESAS
jgi:Protein of unknown function (DUF1360)